jgi:hypothetical protein
MDIPSISEHPDGPDPRPLNVLIPARDHLAFKLATQSQGQQMKAVVPTLLEVYTADPAFVGGVMRGCAQRGESFGKVVLRLLTERFA